MSTFAEYTVAFALSARDLRHGRLFPLVLLLREIGCRVIQVADGDPQALSADLLILYGNCRTFNRYARLLKHRASARPRVAIWQVDPLPPMEFDPVLEARALELFSRWGRSRLMRPIEMLSGLHLFERISKRGFGIYSDRAQGNFVDYAMARTVVEAYCFIRRAHEAGWADLTFSTTVGKQRFLASRGIASTITPASYHDGIGEIRNLQRDIDVVFIGRLTNKARRKSLETVKAALEGTGIRVVVVGRGCFGEARTALLNRTKLVLHLHKYPWDTPWMRWAIASSCGAAVVSETLSDPDPFEPGVHYFEAPLTALPATIGQLLADPERIAAVARNCLRHVRETSNAKRSLETILSESLGASPRSEAGFSRASGA